ncbi:hypothetical protein ALI144C_37615 [Actinosynnema sp. ALI-1.44]|nr:hypothetical protein ALI144C_37615 [Actinosynnema sp. ALI-1.44]
MTCFGVPASATVDTGQVVRTPSGLLRGSIAERTRLFQGIPFAAPPVGAARWRPPDAADRWTGIRDATKPGARCAQDAGQGTPVSTEEDCLYLNVTTPRTPPRHRPLPVLVWLHSGGFISGSGADQHVERLAAAGRMIIVTPNYRLGVFAYFGHPTLAGSGGFGLQDQQAALRWVRTHIAAFGGDPGNVTLGGSSAGAMTACAHLTSPTAAGLFHRLLMQSGGCSQTWPANGIYPGQPPGATWIPSAEVASAGVSLAVARGCRDPASAVDCLRQVPAKDLLYDEVASALPGPGYGNDVLPVDPAQALRDGRFHRVPVLTGTTRDEGRHFAAVLWPQPITPQRYQETLVESFGDHAPRVLARYSIEAFGSAGLAWATVLGDRVWTCTALSGMRSLARHTRVYAYEFADRAAPPFTEFPADIPSGAYHTSEVAYLIDVEGFRPELSPEQRRLATTMTRQWAGFVAGGTPNGHGLPQWPAFTFPATPEKTLSLDTGPGGVHTVDDLAQRHNCAFWSTIPA